MLRVTKHNCSLSPCRPPYKEITMETNSWPRFLPSTDLLELPVQFLAVERDWPPGPSAKVNCVSIRLESPGNVPVTHMSSDHVTSRL